MSTDSNQTQQRTDSVQSLDVFLDFACPWCYIGLYRIAGAQNTSTQMTLRYRAFQLNPTLPPEGIPRETYRVKKFGSLAESQRRDAIVTQAAAAEGLAINFDAIARTPNTRRAHRALKFAADQGQETEFGLRIFQAYFTEGLDIGDPEILVSLATSMGVQLTVDQLEDDGTPQDTAIDADIAAARSAGLTGVPFVVAYAAQGTHAINVPDAVELIHHNVGHTK